MPDREKIFDAILKASTSGEIYRSYYHKTYKKARFRRAEGRMIKNRVREVERRGY